MVYIINVQSRMCHENQLEAKNHPEKNQIVLRVASSKPEKSS